MVGLAIAAAPLVQAKTDRLVQAKTDRLTPSHRAELIRELNAEFGTAKVLIPRSKKPLILRPTGQYNREQWSEAMTKFGPAARQGDMVQITAVRFERKKLVLVLNFGLSGAVSYTHLTLPTKRIV